MLYIFVDAMKVPLILPLPNLMYRLFSLTDKKILPHSQCLEIKLQYDIIIISVLSLFSITL